MEIHRSWLYVPGHRDKMVEKALGLGPDVLVFDLEDAVPEDSKLSARETLASAVASSPVASACFVRTHAAADPNIRADLRAVVRKGLSGIVVSKVERPDDIESVDAMLCERESAAGIPHGHVKVVALIESACGLIQAPAIAASCDRMVGLMFGAEDFARDLGLPSLRKGDVGKLLYARSGLVVAAASEGLQAIDCVYLDYKDNRGLAAETREARQLGFTGKCVIHPGQIEIVRTCYLPTEEELTYARKVVETFEASDGGAVAVEGQMVDLPVLERARRIIRSRGSADEHGGGS